MKRTIFGSGTLWPWRKKAGIGYTFTISEETDGIHPNTADMEILGTKGERLFVRGESLEAEK